MCKYRYEQGFVTSQLAWMPVVVQYVNTFQKCYVEILNQQHTFTVKQDTSFSVVKLCNDQYLHIHMFGVLLYRRKSIFT